MRRLATIVCVLAAVSAIAQLPSYRVVEVGSPSRDYSSVATALNEESQVVTHLRVSWTAASLWTEGSGHRFVGPVSRVNGQSAWAVNESGQVCGAIFRPSTNISKAYVSGPNGGGCRFLNVGDDLSEAYDINDLGHVVGDYAVVRGRRAYWFAFYWKPGQGHTTLRPLDGDVASYARAVNNQGYVAGFSGGSTGIRPVVWDPKGNPTDIGLLPGYQDGYALDINDAGDVVGHCSAVFVGERAFRFNLATGREDLGLPDKGTTADAVNNNGWIVGKLSFNAKTVPGLYVPGLGWHVLSDLILPGYPNRVTLPVSIADNNTIALSSVGPLTVPLLLKPVR